MQIGALIFPTDLSIRPDRLAIAMEERGFESLWVTEHTHIPVGRRTPWPGGPELPEMYRRTLDPFVALTAAAAVTSTLKVGTGVCLVAQHHAITLAKSVASVDLVSDGRFLFGVGVGWNEDEMEHHGVDPKKRRATVRETVLAMRGLWTEEEFGFEGEHVRFSPSWSWPKPVQWPSPPVIMGGAGGPVTFRHIVEYCDGWMPIHGRGNVLEKLPLLRLAIRASTPAHRFQNDGVKKGWEGRGIRDAQIHSSSFLQEARWHKQCAERICIVTVFGWGVNERNEEGNEFHRWPVHNEEVLFE